MDLERAVGISGAVPADANGRRDVSRLVTEIVRAPRPSAGADERCPADRRIEAYLNAHFADLTRAAPLRLPAALALPRHGIARELSLPADADTYRNEYVTSYRV